MFLLHKFCSWSTIRNSPWQRQRHRDIWAICWAPLLSCGWSHTTRHWSSPPSGLLKHGALTSIKPHETWCTTFRPHESGLTTFRPRETGFTTFRPHETGFTTIRPRPKNCCALITFWDVMERDKKPFHATVPLSMAHKYIHFFCLMFHQK